MFIYWHLITTCENLLDCIPTSRALTVAVWLYSVQLLCASTNCVCEVSTDSWIIAMAVSSFERSLAEEKLHDAEQRLRRSLQQILVIDAQIRELEILYKRAQKSKKNASRYNLRLKLSVVSGKSDYSLLAISIQLLAPSLLFYWSAEWDRSIISLLTISIIFPGSDSKFYMTIHNSCTPRQ